MRELHRVSTKALILNKSMDKILLIHMTRRSDWGLPGGHVDKNENPDQAIERELAEECGVKCFNLSHRDFFVHSDGKIILAYIGVLDDEFISSQQGDLEGVPVWLSRDEFEKINIEPVYREFISSNWPSN